MSEGYMRHAESRHCPGMGMGVFATEFIPEGATITDEEALLITANDPETAHFCDRYLALTPEARAELHQLYTSEISLGAYSSETTIQEFRSYWHFHMPNGIIPNENTSMGVGEFVQTMRQAMAIFSTNNSETQYEHLAGLFSRFSRFNHSCAPNAAWNPYAGEDDRARMEVTAIRDINAGEQIYISYIGDDEQHWAERQKLLLYWGFICQCERCQQERAQGYGTMLHIGVNSDVKAAKKSNGSPENSPPTQNQAIAKDDGDNAQFQTRTINNPHFNPLTQIQAVTNEEGGMTSVTAPATVITRADALMNYRKRGGQGPATGGSGFP
ncbi:hypothetical protein GGS26DRAFT_585795 [Hypomontagnella submonticulosa]|nr:hypothetical protein GGS26DRAFT_585795 [Hypomontagnella submonticulosa]